MVTLFPQAFTGTSTGAWTLLPEPTPVELLVSPPAWEPPPCPVDPAPEPLPLPQSVPMAGLSSPTTFTVFPHAFTGTLIGAWTEFPDATPGELDALPFAPESACA
jgi:hypothetical protein